MMDPGRVSFLEADLFKDSGSNLDASRKVSTDIAPMFGSNTPIR
jgi:hypothetical protein